MSVFQSGKLFGERFRKAQRFKRTESAGIRREGHASVLRFGKIKVREEPLCTACDLIFPVMPDVVLKEKELPRTDVVIDIALGDIDRSLCDIYQHIIIRHAVGVIKGLGCRYKITGTNYRLACR